MELIRVAVFLSCVLMGEGHALMNSSAYCFEGTEQNIHLNIKCGTNSIAALYNLYLGAKPLNGSCNVNSSAAECCTYNEGEDCFSAKPKYLESIVSSCSGHGDCRILAKRLSTFVICSSDIIYPDQTTYGFVEYECINLGQLTDICHQNVGKTGQPGQVLYLNHNIHHNTTKPTNSSCHCRFTTECGANIIFEAMDIRNKRSHLDSCSKSLMFKDDRNPEKTESIGCKDRFLYGGKQVFVSESNHASVKMLISGDPLDKRKIWIRVRSSWANGTLQLHCGYAAEIDAENKNHLCDVDTATTQPQATSIPTEVTSVTGPDTTKAACNPKTDKNCQTSTVKVIAPGGDKAANAGLEPGAIVGIAVAGLVILIVLVIILVLIFRKTRPQPEEVHDYETPASRDPDYETLRNYRKMGPNNAYVNPGYEKNGDLGPHYDNPGDLGACPDHFAFDHDYDNQHNDSVMTMPKGAVLY